MRKSKVELLEDRIAEIKLNCKHIDVIPIEVTTETLSVYVGGELYPTPYDVRKVLTLKCMDCGRIIQETVKDIKEVI